MTFHPQITPITPSTSFAFLPSTLSKAISPDALDFDLAILAAAEATHSHTEVTN
jgi:hypothetical protein